MQYVYELSYQDQPDYDTLRQLFIRELRSRKMKDNGKDLDWLPSRKVRGRATESLTSYCLLCFLHVEEVIR